MAYGTRGARPQSRVAERSLYEGFGLIANVNESFVAGIAVALGVMVVALIAVLMGMA